MRLRPAFRGRKRLATLYGLQDSFERSSAAQRGRLQREHQTNRVDEHPIGMANGPRQRVLLHFKHRNCHPGLDSSLLSRTGFLCGEGGGAAAD